MGQVTRLTEMQMKFAHEIVSNEGRKNGTECAISAGYDDVQVMSYEGYVS